MRVLVVGSAHEDHRRLVRSELTALHVGIRIGVLIHGCLGGVGTAAEEWARHVGVPIVKYPPNGIHHGKAAEAKRNAFMIADARADIVVAFPGGSHTDDLIRRALQAGLAVYKVPHCSQEVRP